MAKVYVRSAITHILSDLKRMRTITHTIGTRPPRVLIDKWSAINSFYRPLATFVFLDLQTNASFSSYS